MQVYQWRERHVFYLWHEFRFLFNLLIFYYIIIFSARKSGNSSTGEVSINQSIIFERCCTLGSKFVTEEWEYWLTGKFSISTLSGFGYKMNNRSLKILRKRISILIILLININFQVAGRIIFIYNVIMYSSYIMYPFLKIRMSKYKLEL